MARLDRPVGATCPNGEVLPAMEYYLALRVAAFLKR